MTWSLSMPSSSSKVKVHGLEESELDQRIFNGMRKVVREVSPDYPYNVCTWADITGLNEYDIWKWLDFHKVVPRAEPLKGRYVTMREIALVLMSKGYELRLPI